MIYDLEEADGVRGLVLELVEGTTLADRLQGGPLPVSEALTIARQIADGLDAAHEKGIVHRDLKPANVKIAPNGAVKILDFGLAKVVAGEGAMPDLPQSPTVTVDGTREGMILGTTAYMSPEQARGQVVDKRTDIWAFGCVLYEMLTGRAAFGHATVTDTLAAIVEREPDWAGLPSATPMGIRRLLPRCLDKDLRRRLHDIADARIEIEEAAAPTEEPVASASARSARLAWVVATAAVLVAAFAIPAGRYLRETPPPSSSEMRLQIVTPSTTAPFEFALSPDGRYIVFVTSGDGTQRLWLRALDKTDALPLAGTDGADFPFWSPDSRSIGFFASGKLFRIDIAGGPPQALANAAVGRGGAWNAHGTILFASGINVPLSRIAASGGDPTAATRLDPPRQLGHRFPQFLPDGRHFLFWVNGSREASGLHLGSLDGEEPKRLTAADTTGAYLKRDRVVFMQQEALVARRLDLTRGDLMGDPVTLADPVGYDSNVFLGAFSVSADGRVAYRAGGAGRRQLTCSIGRASGWAWRVNRTGIT